MENVNFKKNNNIIKVKRKKSIFSKYLKYKALFIMFIPAIVYYIVFHYAPMYGVIIAFKDYKILKGIMSSQWVGLKYFKLALSAPDFWAVFKNTIIISGYKLLFGFPAPIILALLFNEVRNMRFKKVIQSITYIPHFLSWVVLSGIIINFLSPSTGPINMLRIALGLKPVFFVADYRWFRTVLVASSLWKEVGWGTIVYLAALAGVNPELYEAASLDGAGKLRQIINVTLPAISSVIVIMFIFAVGGIINDDFDQIFNLYNSAVLNVGDVISTYVYRQGLVSMQYSYSAAVGLFKNVIAFALILFTNFVSRKFSDYGLW